jgi:hypothetical protein
VDTKGRQQVDSGRNQKESNIESSEQQDSNSKDNLTLGLPTLDKIPELDLLEPPPLSLNTSVKKKPHYIIVPTNEAEPKKNIVGNIGEQNIVKGKRLKEQLKAYIGFLADITKDQSFTV